MGLSIHYSGYILQADLIKPLIDEVVDICSDLEWSFEIINDEVIDGVLFWPEKSEPVSLTFNKNGRILSPQNIIVKDIYDGEKLASDLIFTTSTKTQYAGVEAHIAIVKLLRHLSKKYMKDFVMDDEGLYWETNDEKVLKDQFNKYNEAISIICETLKSMPHTPEESCESLGDKIERILRGKFGRNRY